jgi:recombinational DNA repair protein (RecF pathway)
VDRAETLAWRARLWFNVAMDISYYLLENPWPVAGLLVVAGVLAAAVWFARRMLDRLGYAPELHVCASCGSRLEERPARFSAAAGGLLCPVCAPRDVEGVDCPVTAIKVLRVAAAGDAGLYARLRLGPGVLAVLEQVLERELARHIDRRLRSLDVLRSLL